MGLTVEGSDSVSLSLVPKAKGIKEEGRTAAIEVCIAFELSEWISSMKVVGMGLYEGCGEVVEVEDGGRALL